MNEKRIPLKKTELEAIAAKHTTPFHLYDEKAIRENARAFYKAFSWAHGFKNHYAIKACPNPAILKILYEEGMGVDCSSLPELVLAEKVGFRGEEIILTSNDTPPEEFAEAARLGALINLDDIGHIETLEKSAGIPEMISFRYNPGNARTGNVLIGLPQEAKYGVTRARSLKPSGLCRQKERNALACTPWLPLMSWRIVILLKLPVCFLNWLLRSKGKAAPGLN